MTLLISYKERGHNEIELKTNVYITKPCGWSIGYRAIVYNNITI